MKQVRRFVPAALAAMIAGAVACGGDSTGTGPQAASVTGIAGDSQAAPTGGTLAFPLSFVALGSGGQPAQGVHVTWSVIPGGAASFTPATSVTDVNGTAATTATLGSFIGAVTIHAAVPGVPDVVYHATVIDPCLYLNPFTIGQTVNAALASTDCRRTFGNLVFYYDFYVFSLTSGTQSIRISMRGGSSTFDDTYMDFFRGSDGRFMAFDDDSVLGVAGARNSQLDIILPGADYIIGASSYDAFTTGSYSLVGTSRAVAMNGCREVWVVRGISVSDSITPSDCADSAATPYHYYDVARMVVYAGTVLSIAEHSTAMNPSLAIYKVVPDSDYVRHLVASNDDSAAGHPNAFVRLTVDTSNYYDIFIGSSAGGETGAYTFDVLADTTLSSPAFPVDRRRDPWGVLGLPRRAKH
jgi:hypothetical protein